jgi:carboxypeptidase Q
LCPQVFLPKSLPNTVEQAALLRDKALKSELAWDILESLTTEISPRMAGIPADAAAVSWALAKLHSLNFDKVWTEPVTVPVWPRLHESAYVVSPYAQALTIAALGGSVRTPKGGIIGEIIHFNTFEDLVASPANSAVGKIVYFSYKMERHPSGRGYGQAGPASFMGPAEAAKKGAIALVIRSVGNGSLRPPHTGMTHYENGVKKIPAAALSNPDVDKMDRILKHNNQSHWP